MTTLLKSIFWGDNQRRILWGFVTFVCFLGIFRAVWFFLGNHVKGAPASRLKLENIHVLEPPAWVGTRFVEESLAGHPALAPLRDIAENANGISINDAELANKLTVAFESHPWTERVESLRLEYPANVTVKIVFRKPVAVVAAPENLYADFKGGGFPIDANGVLLPIDYFQEHSHLMYNFIWIEGITSAPMRSYGEPWNDPLVIEAAMLADFLRESNNLFQIRRIVVRTSPASEPGGLYDLITVKGTKIHWGTFPLSGNLPAKELKSSPQRFDRIKQTVLRSQEDKLSHLRVLIDKHGSLDAVPNDMKPIDLSKYKNREFHSL